MKQPKFKDVFFNGSLCVFTGTITFIFFMGIIYCTNQIKGSDKVLEHLFFSSVLLLFVKEIYRGINTFIYFLKNEKFALAEEKGK